MNKITKNNLITYGIVIAAYIILEILMLTGESHHMSDVKYIGGCCGSNAAYIRALGRKIYGK